MGRLMVMKASEHARYAEIHDKIARVTSRRDFVYDHDAKRHQQSIQEFLVREGWADFIGEAGLMYDGRVFAHVSVTQITERRWIVSAYLILAPKVNEAISNSFENTVHAWRQRRG